MVISEDPVAARIGTPISVDARAPNITTVGKFDPFAVLVVEGVVKAISFDLKPNRDFGAGGGGADKKSGGECHEPVQGRRSEHRLQHDILFGAKIFSASN